MLWPRCSVLDPHTHRNVASIKSIRVAGNSNSQLSQANAACPSFPTLRATPNVAASISYAPTSCLHGVRKDPTMTYVGYLGCALKSASASKRYLVPTRVGRVRLWEDKYLTLKEDRPLAVLWWLPLQLQTSPMLDGRTHSLMTCFQF